MNNKLLLLIISISLFLLENNIDAQTYIKPMLIGMGDPTIDNDDTIQFFGYNLPNNSFFSTGSPAQYSQGEICDSYHVNPNPPDPQYPGILNNIFHLFRNGSTDTSIAMSSIVYPKFNFEITSFTAPSSIYSQDGEMTLYFDSLINIENINATTSFEAWHPDLNGIYAPFSGQIMKRIGIFTSDGHTIHFKNLRLGPVVIEIIDGPEIKDQFQNFIYIGNPNETYILNLGIYAHLAHRLISAPDCGTMFNLEPTELFDTPGYTVNYTVTGPSSSDFYYATSNESLNAFHICPGVYKIRMESDDFSGFGGYQDYDFVQIDPEQTYFDISLSNSFQDSIGLYYKNCSFDFTSPITAIDLDYQVIATDPYGTNVYTLDFAVSQDMVVTHFFDTLIVENIENYKLVIGIYCDELKGKKSFVHKGIAMVPNETMSINHQELESFITVSPNPAKETLTIQSNDAFDTYTIYDLKGRAIQSGEISPSNIDIQLLDNGMYLIQLNGSNKSSLTKFIKE